MKNVSVVIIGGGATGTGIARLAAESGYSVTLIEQGSMASGTTGHFHGMLHSGARYAVNDTSVAAACFLENQRLSTIIPDVIRKTGGLFLAMNDEEASHGDALENACRAAGIPIEEISVETARKHEPYVSNAVKRAFIVPDGTIDGMALVTLNRKAAESAEIPARFITNHRVERFSFDNNMISSVHVQDKKTGENKTISCDVVINATGVWTGVITALAGISLEMMYDKGTMIVFDAPLSSAVLNRCRPEFDGDLLVPLDGHSIMGTTTRVVESPDDNIPTQEEVDVLVREGGVMVPSMQDADALRVYAGIRPLQKPLTIDTETVHHSTRDVSRGFQILDHTSKGVNNFISVTGGKVTLYRLMSEKVVDVLNERYA